MDLKKIIAQQLRIAADKIESNSCGLTESEILQLVQSVMHQELTKTESAQFLNISTRTFDRYIEKGVIPPGHKKNGSTQLLWYKDELILNNEL